MLDHQYIKKLAADAGFDLCGLAPCRHLVENESMLRAWLGKGYQSSLAYMERNVAKRAHPRKQGEGASTAGVCAGKAAAHLEEDDEPKIYMDHTHGGEDT